MSKDQLCLIVFRFFRKRCFWRRVTSPVPRGAGLPEARPCGSPAPDSGEGGRAGPNAPPAASALPGESQARLFPRDPQNRVAPPLAGIPGNAGRAFAEPPGRALTCGGGRAAQNPGPPGSGAQVWGCWPCPPETCPLEPRCGGGRQVTGGRRGAGLSPRTRTRGVAFLGHDSPPGLGNRELRKGCQLRTRENLGLQGGRVSCGRPSPSPLANARGSWSPAAGGAATQASEAAGQVGALSAATAARAGRVQSAPLPSFSSLSHDSAGSLAPHGEPPRASGWAAQSRALSPPSALPLSSWTALVEGHRCPGTAPT